VELVASWIVPVVDDTDDEDMYFDFCPSRHTGLSSMESSCSSNITISSTRSTGECCHDNQRHAHDKLTLLVWRNKDFVSVQLQKWFWEILSNQNWNWENWNWFLIFCALAAVSTNCLIICYNARVNKIMFMSSLPIFLFLCHQCVTCMPMFALENHPLNWYGIEFSVRVVLIFKVPYWTNF